jgi:rubrerythrin
MSSGNGHMAAPELGAIDIKGMTRSSFIVRGALAAGAVYGAGTVGPFVRQALAQSGGGDIEVLNFALTLEYLEAAFYKEAGSTTKLSDEAGELVTTFGKEEQDHVDTLTKTITDLGGKPVAAPMVDFGDLSSESAFLKLAVTFEDTGVSAYNGAAPSIQSKEVLGAAGSIVQVEARHAAAIRLLDGKEPAPDAFDPALSQSKVLEAVQPFVKS